VRPQELRTTLRSSVPARCGRLTGSCAPLLGRHLGCPGLTASQASSPAQLDGRGIFPLVGIDRRRFARRLVDDLASQLIHVRRPLARALRHDRIVASLSKGGFPVPKLPAVLDRQALNTLPEGFRFRPCLSTDRDENQPVSHRPDFRRNEVLNECICNRPRVRLPREVEVEGSAIVGQGEALCRALNNQTDPLPTTDGRRRARISDAVTVSSHAGDTFVPGSDPVRAASRARAARARCECSRFQVLPSSATVSSSSAGTKTGS
jgi:hypothetical protein